MNGICSFFNDGVLSEKLYYKNDSCEGLGFEVLYGKEFAWYTYLEGKKVGNVFDLNGGYKKEVNIETKEVMSICLYNERFERNGVCFLFSQTDDGTIEITSCPSLKEFHIQVYSFTGYDTLYLNCINND